MMKQALLLAALIVVVSQTAMGDTPIVKARGALGASATVGASDRIQDALHLIAGVFQRYEPNRNLVRISDVDYELDPSLALRGSKLREFRYGQKVLFTQTGVSDAGRNVVTTIEPQ